ncbi:hypothetical protein ABIE89_000182 [Bradyrhizobium niftali]
MLLGSVVAAIATIAVVGTRFEIAELFVGQSATNADATRQEPPYSWRSLCGTQALFNKGRRRSSTREAHRDPHRVDPRRIFS